MDSSSAHSQNSLAPFSDRGYLCVSQVTVRCTSNARRRIKMPITNAAKICVIAIGLATYGLACGQAMRINPLGKTSSEILRDHGIDGSEPSLISALRNPDSQVRTTAAYKLASGHFSDAVPAVEQALAEEKDELARVGLATALVSLHDPLGIAFLQERCADAREPIRSAMVATQEIQLYGASPSGCVESMVERLQDPSSADYRDALIPLVASLYPSATKAQATIIVSSLQRMLNDKSQQAYVRMAAGHGLAQIGLPSSLAFIEEALSTETDEVMRSAFMSDRDALHKAGNP